MKNLNELLEAKKVEITTLEDTKKALRNVQSKKSRLAKQKMKPNYDELMKEYLSEEQVLKELVKYYSPTKITTTTMSQDDIALLTFDETMKAIKSIQSKKCNSQYNDDQTDYEKACQTEEWLLAHKETVKPNTNDNLIEKSKINDLIETIKETNNKTVKVEWLLEQLENMTK